ncbi:MAG TPA: MBL fold metallo-hydrolase [Candidatus Krumholzibacteria bacterium]|nr:MBL fold metallo-hydrolase [Candidatus Krumholzibacteria bacterium]
MISIVLFGTGGAVPTPDRSPSASWLTLDGRSLLLDPGPGALARLVASPHGPDSLDAVDAVLFTHLHPDHCADLLPLLFALRLRSLTSERDLQLIGPRGLAAYVEGLRGLYGEWAEPRRRRLEVLELAPGQGLSTSSDTDGGWTVTSADDAPVRAFRAAHFEDRFSVWNLGYRLRDASGHTLALSGDSGPCAELAAAARGADLLVVECSLPSGRELEGHLTPEQVAALCLETEPASVVLTHLPPGEAGAEAAALVRAAWSGPVTPARDGDLFAVPIPLREERP